MLRCCAALCCHQSPWQSPRLECDLPPSLPATPTPPGPLRCPLCSFPRLRCCCAARRSCAGRCWEWASAWRPACRPPCSSRLTKCRRRPPRRCYTWVRRVLPGRSSRDAVPLVSCRVPDALHCRRPAAHTSMPAPAVCPAPYRCCSVQPCRALFQRHADRAPQPRGSGLLQRPGPRRRRLPLQTGAPGESTLAAAVPCPPRCAAPQSCRAPHRRLAPAAGCPCVSAACCPSPACWPSHLQFAPPWRLCRPPRRLTRRCTRCAHS